MLSNKKCIHSNIIYKLKYYYTIKYEKIYESCTLNIV